MQAFKDKAAAETATTPPRSSPAAISHAPPPTVPPKDKDRPGVREREIKIADGGRRPSSSTRRRTSEGGLTGTYSTSVPSGGGYFPEHKEVDEDEAELSRRERSRAREEKQRALKAAWGIDTRE